MFPTVGESKAMHRVLAFLATTDVRRAAGPPVAEDGEGAASEVSEWEDRER